MSDTSGDKPRRKGISVTCIACDRVIKVPVERAGTRGRCPKCGATVEIPSLDGSPVVRGHTRALVPDIDAPSPRATGAAASTSPPKPSAAAKAETSKVAAAGTGKVAAPASKAPVPKAPVPDASVPKARTGKVAAPAKKGVRESTRAVDASAAPVIARSTKDAGPARADTKRRAKTAEGDPASDEDLVAAAPSVTKSAGSGRVPGRTATARRADPDESGDDDVEADDAEDDDADDDHDGSNGDREDSDDEDSDDEDSDDEDSDDEDADVEDADEDDTDDESDDDEGASDDEDEPRSASPRSKSKRSKPREVDDDEPRVLHGSRGKSNIGFYLIVLLALVAVGVGVAAGGYYLLDTGDPGEMARRYYAAVLAGDEDAARACVVGKQAKGYLLVPEDKEHLVGSAITYGDVHVSSKTARVRVEIRLASGVKENKIVALVREDVKAEGAWMPAREWRVDPDASDRESQALQGQ